MLPLQVETPDQITSLYGAVGKLLYENSLPLEQISEIVLTGVGSTHIREDIYGIPTYKVDEFSAIGCGGLTLCGLKEATVVSMGTGTAFCPGRTQRLPAFGRKRRRRWDSCRAFPPAIE